MKWRSRVSIINEKILKDLDKYLKANADENVSDEATENLINEFMMSYNNRIGSPVTDEPETSDDYLELAYEARNKKEALKFAKKALALEPYNFDADALVIELKAKNETELVIGYAKAVQKATEYMKKEGYFEEEYIGDFWGVLETRPYMRLRGRFTEILIQCGKMGQACEECRELLRLCKNDNLGIRYQLMHIYAYFENEEAAIALYKHFKSHSETQMLLPLSILYYKKGKYVKAWQYLRKLNSVNKDLKQFMQIFSKGMFEEFDDVELMEGYRPDTMEEFIMEFRENLFLFCTMTAYAEWALQKIKKLD